MAAASAVAGSANTDVYAISTASKIIDAFTGSASGDQRRPP